MKAHELAQKAADILKQRGTDNGYDAGEERSAATIAKVYNLITGHELTEADAWMFLIVLKLVREGRKHQLDNLLDLSNYALLLAESNQPTGGKVSNDNKPFACNDPMCGAGWRISDGGTVHLSDAFVPKITITDGDETVGGKRPEGGKPVTLNVGVNDNRLSEAVRAELIKACQPGGQLFRQISTYNHPTVK